MCQLKAKGGRCNGYFRSRVNRAQARFDKVDAEHQEVKAKRFACDPKDYQSLKKEHEKIWSKWKLAHSALRQAENEYLDKIEKDGLRLPGKNISSMRRHQQELSSAVDMAIRNNREGSILPQIKRTGEVVREWVGTPDSNKHFKEYEEKLEALKAREAEILQEVGSKRDISRHGSYMREFASKGETMTNKRKIELIYSLSSEVLVSARNKGMSQDEAEEMTTKMLDVADEARALSTEYHKRMAKDEVGEYSKWKKQFRHKMGFNSEEAKIDFVEKASHKGAMEAVREASEMFPPRWTNSSDSQIVAQGSKRTARDSFCDNRYHSYEQDNALTQTRVFGKGEPNPYLGFPDAQTKQDVLDYYNSGGNEYRFMPVTEDDVTETEGGMFSVTLTPIESKRSKVKPKGDGWEKVSDKKDYNGRYEYRRPYRGKTTAPHPTFKVEKSDGTPRTRSVAIHEYTHFMEYANPKLGKLQGAYLQERRERAGVYQLSHLGAGYSRGEVGYRGVFPNDYQAKDYQDGKHYEILSMAFEEELGGQKVTRPTDEETKNFAWGVLFSA